MNSLHEAAQKGDLETAKVLLKSNPDLVFSKDDRGRMPLHMASAKGHRDVAELMQQYGG